MDNFEDILNECIIEAIEASELPVSEKYIELKEVTPGKAKTIFKNIKSRLTPDVVKKTGEAAKEVGKTAKRIKGLATAAFVLVLIKKARDTYRSLVHKRCAKFQGNELSICKIKTIEFTMNQLNSYKSECSKTNNPEDCKQRINMAISKLSKEREVLKNKMIKK